MNFKFKIGDLVKFSSVRYRHIGASARSVGCILKVRPCVLDTDGNKTPTYDVLWSCNVAHHRQLTGVCLERWLLKL